MIDYKYHVTTLVALFLALGIGVLIGSMMLGGEFIDRQQELLIDRLEHDFQQMRIQNGMTRSELAAAKNSGEIYEKFCRQVMPILIKDKLKNFRVAVIQTNSSSNLNDIVDPLKMAGADVEAAVTVLDDFSLANVSAGAVPETGEEIQPVQMLGEAILYGDDQNLLAEWKKNKLVKFEGITGEPIDAVILAGGSETDMGEQVKGLDLGLCDYFLHSNIRVIGVETSSVAYSYMTYYQSRHIITIDNIQSVPGQIALVYSVLGEQGNYGTKKTAKKLIPDLW